MNDSFTNFDTVPLRDLLKKSDSGTWGDEAEYAEGSPVLRSTNIVDNRLCLNEPAWRHLSDAHRTQKRLRDGDIIVTSSSGSPDHIGKCAVFETAESNGKAYFFSNFTLRLRPAAENLDSKWLYYWLTSPRGRHEMFRLNNTTSGLRNLNKGAYLSQQIPLPKLEEQKRIAAILAKADAIRRQRQEALDASTHLIEVAFHHLFGDCLANEHQFPECEFQELCGRIVDCPHSTPTYADRLTEFACVRSSDIQDGYIDWISTKYVEKDEYEVRVARHTPIAGEVLYTREGGRMGNAARVPENAKVCLGQRIMLFSAKEVETTNEFIWALLNSPGVKHQVKSLTAGAAAPRINISDIRKLKAFRPPFDLQQQFTSAVARIEQLREKQIAAHEDETHLFNSLVQRAFKGEL